MQVGAIPLHIPLIWHVRVAVPTNTNPELQLYVAVVPKEV